MNLSRKGGQLEKKRDEEFFVVEQIMENGNIKLRDWNTNRIEDRDNTTPTTEENVLGQHENGRHRKEFQKM